MAAVELPASQIRFDPKPSQNSHAIVSPNGKRISIVFYPPSVGQVWLSNNPMAAVDQGLVIGAGQGPVTLTVKVHGEMVQHEWHCINDVGLHPVSWIETSAL